MTSLTVVTSCRWDV